VAGAELALLPHHLDRPGEALLEGSPDILELVSEDGEGPPRPEPARQIHRPEHERPAGDAVEHLGSVGLHARAEAGREDQDVEVGHGDD
jgi:hypothetical protein